MFENPRRGRQARNFTTNVPKILVLKSSSEQIFSRKLPLGAPVLRTYWAVYDICRVQTADCRLQMSYTAYRAPRFIRVLLTKYSVSRARRDTSYNDPYRQAPPRKWYFLQPSNFVYLKWGMKKWISRGSLPFKGRYTRGILLQEQISSVCTNDFMGTIHPREQNQWPAPVGPLAQLVRALHRYRVGHGLNPGKPGHFRAFFS